MADDLDIVPDGSIYFSEATIRYSLGDWILDSFEGIGNGKISCFDPASGKTSTILRNLRFPNGVCTSHNGDSILFNETWSCSVSRYWVTGPKAGKKETVVGDLPGFPDNINRASDGTYWVAIAGIRTPVWDIAMRQPGFRNRMIKRLPRDEWLFPNVNTGFIAKITESGEVLDVLWDRRGINHPAVTSMREHKGYLYIGGLTNNRIGRIPIEGADKDWVGSESYWGKAND
jgi:ribose transport system permease protein